MSEIQDEIDEIKEILKGTTNKKRWRLGQEKLLELEEQLENDET